MADAPRLIPFRQGSGKAAIVMLHGFSGDARKTWGNFPALLESQPALDHWDIYSLGYTTSLTFDVAGIWAADPAIVTLGGLLSTAANVSPLDSYDAIALVAHSMGGLMAQRALLLDPELRKRVSHLLLFGTPSAGLTKASPFAFWKRQVRDMASDSAFITSLRQEWSQSILPSSPFTFVAVAGDRDEFVPISSSLDPFPAPQRRVVNGNHLEIVKPSSADHLGFKVAVKTLCGDGTLGLFDTARLAIESRQFQHAIDALWPVRAELDDDGLVALALALDSVNRRAEAIELLRASTHAGTDPMGVLAGRLKRRWLAEHRRDDAMQAMALYQAALEQSAGTNAAQTFYHAINCAFMALAFSGDAAAARDYATRALAACAASGSDNLWRHATEGEAQLYLGQTDASMAAYTRAMTRGPQPWQAASMYQQAVRAADLTGNAELMSRLPFVLPH